MTKLSRNITIFAGVLVILVVIAIAALPGLLALDQVKKQVALAVSHSTGRPVTIAHLSISLYPWLGIRLRGASLGNPPGFGRTPLARVGEALLEVRVLPLLSRHIVLRRVILTGLKLDLRENKAGLTNWASLTRPHTVTKTTPAEVSAEAHEAPAFALLKAAGLTVKHASIAYHNARTGAADTLSDFSLRSGAIVPGQPIALRLAGRIQAGAHPAVAFRVVTKAFKSGADFVLNPLQLTIATLHAQGQLRFSTARAGLVAHGQFVIPPFAPRPLLATLGLHYVPSNPNVLKTASAALAFQLTPGRLRIQPLRLTLDRTIVTGSLTRYAHPVGYRGRLRINVLRPAGYLAKAPAGSGKAAGAGHVPARPAPLPQWPVHATLRIGAFHFHGLTLTHVHAVLVSQKGVLSLRPLTSDLYGGTFAGALLADTSHHPLAWRLHARLRQVHLGALLQGLHLFPEVSGSLDGQAALQGGGKTLKAAEQTLSGTASGAIQKGALRGLDLDLIAQDPRLAAGTHRAKKVAGTAFSHLRIQATISHGVVTTPNLAMQTSRAKVRGHGTVTLLTKTVNYLLNVTLLDGLTVPVQVQGPPGHVHFSVSLNRLFSDHNKGNKAVLRNLGSRLKKLFGFH